MADKLAYNVRVILHIGIDRCLQGMGEMGANDEMCMTALQCKLQLLYTLACDVSEKSWILYCHMTMHFCEFSIIVVKYVDIDRHW